MAATCKVALEKKVQNDGGTDGQNFFGHDLTSIVVGEDLHTEREGLDVHLFQERNFGVTDLLTLGTNLDFLGNFDLTLLNLGRDGQSVEEVNL